MHFGGPVLVVLWHKPRISGQRPVCCVYLGDGLTCGGTPLTALRCWGRGGGAPASVRAAPGWGPPMGATGVAPRGQHRREGQGSESVCGWWQVGQELVVLLRERLFMTLVRGGKADFILGHCDRGCCNGGERWDSTLDTGVSKSDRTVPL